MITMIAAGVVVAGRSHLADALGLAAAITAPRLTAVMVVAALVAELRSRRGSSHELQFHQLVASELRGGASLRHGLAAALAAGEQPGLALVRRRLLAGSDIEAEATSLRPHLPHTGRLAEAAIVFGARSGGRAAEAFQTMAEIATGEAELRREVGAALAPAWLAVGLIGGAPAVGLATLLVSGRLGEAVASAPGRVSVAVGGTLVAAGALAVWTLARRVLR